MLSVVIPVYNEEGGVPAAARETAAVLRRARIPYELVFVDDGSKDGPGMPFAPHPGRTPASGA